MIKDHSDKEPTMTQDQRIENWLNQIDYCADAGDVLAFADLDDGAIEIVATLAGRGARRKTFNA